MGRRRKPPELHVVDGTRARYGSEPAIEALDRDPERPPWVTGAARRVWDRKLARYAERGQSVAGCEDLLAQYCALEADLIAKRKAGVEVPAAMLNAYRMMAADFLESPSSQVGKVDKRGKNPFTDRGMPPPPPGQR